jgi:hypothetical protein
MQPLLPVPEGTRFILTDDYCTDFLEGSILIPAGEDVDSPPDEDDIACYVENLEESAYEYIDWEYLEVYEESPIVQLYPLNF